MTTARMSQYFMEIIGPYCERPSRAGLFIQEILKYELAIYQARTTPTPEHLFESQSNAATLDVETLEPERLCFSPSFLLRSFKADIYKMLAALAVENHHYELLEVPLEIAFYEDAVNGDIIQEVVEAEMKKVLDDLRESQFKNNGKFKGPLPDLIKKGIVIYRKK
jgi:hypothetical protein